MKKIYKREFKRNDNKHLLLYGYSKHVETSVQEIEKIDSQNPNIRLNPEIQ